MKVWTQYAHMVSIFCKDLKKFILYFLPLKPRGGEDITSCVEIFREWGGFHPRGWISPPCPYCQIREGGDITPRVEIYEKRGGFHPRGGYHPLVLIWPQSTGEFKHYLSPQMWRFCSNEGISSFLLFLDKRSFLSLYYNTCFLFQDNFCIPTIHLGLIFVFTARA